MKSVQQELDKILNTKKEPGISTGIKKLDNFIYGFRPNNLIVLGGVSSSGKTSLMTDFIIAASEQVGVGVFSLEMGLDIVDRAIHNMADLNYHRCLIKKTKEETERYEETKELFRKLKPIYEGDGVNTLYPDWRLESGFPKNSIEGKMKDMYANGARIFFLDYIQLVQWGNKTESETLRLKEITNKLHTMSLQYGVPIIILSQLTKATADRANKKDQDPTPTLSDLRDSGFLVNDADIILLLHRPDYYKKKKEGLDLLSDMSETAQIIISKYRSGPTGAIPVTFRSYSMSFRDMDNELLF